MIKLVPLGTFIIFDKYLGVSLKTCTIIKNSESVDAGWK